MVEVVITISIPTFLPSFDYCYNTKESKRQNFLVLHMYPAILADFTIWQELDYS
jgi:hypothetical protein